MEGRDERGRVPAGQQVAARACGHAAWEGPVGAAGPGAARVLGVFAHLVSFSLWLASANSYSEYYCAARAATHTPNLPRPYELVVV